MYPHAILGKKENTKKKSKKTSTILGNFFDIYFISLILSLETRHTDAIMGLSWNTQIQNILASSSADTTVKLWDLNTLKPIKTYTHHTSKVASVLFNPKSPSIFLSASFDKRICVLDARIPDSYSSVTLSSDPEVLKWDPWNEFGLVCSDEAGFVNYFDARMLNGNQTKSVFLLQASHCAVSALDINEHIPGMMITGSADKTVKIWDIQGKNVIFKFNYLDSKPAMIHSRDLEVGQVFTTQFSPDDPYLVSVGGSKGTLSIWNVTENASIRNVFEGRKKGDEIISMTKFSSLIKQSDDMVEEEEEEEYVDEDKAEIEETLMEMSGLVLENQDD